MSAFLASIDPKLFYLCVSALSGGIIYLWRKFSYASWDAVTRGNPNIEKLPAIILAGLMSIGPALDKKSLSSALFTILAGALFGGATAILGHHALKDSPAVSYTGATPPLFPPGSGATPTSELPTPRSTPVAKP